jgi:AcrR family transcriptional regulator
VAESVTTRAPRADARRNREKLLAAATAAFAAEGEGVALETIAARAGVGVGTVYRRFPQKELLIEALFEERVGELVAIAERALEEDDPWEALVGFLERAQALQATNRGLKELVLSTIHGRERVACVRERLAPLADALVERAQASGQLRPDVDGTDLPIVQVMLGAVVDVTRDVAPDTWRRMLAIFVDGLRACEPQTPLPAAPLDSEQIVHAMRSWRPSPC